MTSAPHCAVTLERLIDYATGDLGTPEAATFEAHLFTCESCAERLEALVALTIGIRDAVNQGQTAAVVTGPTVDQALARGATVRQYHLSVDQTVACTAAPEDDFVVMRLTGIPPGISALTVDVEFHDLTTGARHQQRIDDTPVDAMSHEAIMLFPGAVVRAYPRSQWTMAAHGHVGDTSVPIGTYRLDHTPWDDLPPLA